MMDSRKRKRNRETDSEFARQIVNSQKDGRFAKKMMDSRNRKQIRETESEFAKKIVISRKR